MILVFIMGTTALLLNLLTTGCLKQRFSQNLLDIPIDRLLGSLVVDSSKIRNTLNWQPPFTMDEGLQKTLRP